jgi:HAD superfamily hydrolase (TIGR01509 family)
MNARSAKAVIFDMDGVILDSQGLALKAWARAVADLGYCLTEDLNLELVGRNVPDSNAILQRALGPAFPVEAARRAAREFFAELTPATGVPLKPGVEQFLDFLESKGVRKAVATSTPRPACVRHLQHWKLLDRFSVVVCGDEVPSGKPAPDIFLQAARLLNVQPADCVVIEDSFAGIRAAHAAAMIPIMVPDLKAPDDTIRGLAYRVVRNLDEAREVIAALI